MLAQMVVLPAAQGAMLAQMVALLAAQGEIPVQMAGPGALPVQKALLPVFGVPTRCSEKR
ncbi:hypothetical protein OI70_18495 [Dickeya fangzhongdai]|nr:hypothetical protein OI70_18495 [Dickeya fangzhongdai]